MLREVLNSGLTLMERRDIITTMFDILKKGGLLLDIHIVYVLVAAYEKVSRLYFIVYDDISFSGV